MARALKQKDLISMKELSPQEVQLILKRACEMERIVARKGFCSKLRNKLVAVLFLEPSTRTRLSFETAAHRLGAGVITVAETSSSSLAKGESIYDMVKVIAGYADAIVLRQPQAGICTQLARMIDVPLINAGDGAGEHPTQALLDLYTIQQELGRLKALKVALVGDLRYGRTVHSLVRALVPFKASFVCCAPAELALPNEMVAELAATGISLSTVSSLAEVLTCDVVYMTRLQRERFPDPKVYERLKGSYVLKRELLVKNNSQALILHPLPRVDEIASDVDDLPQAAYFRQARNGLFIRMALLDLLIS